MKQYSAFGFASLLLTLMMFSFACKPCVLYPPNVSTPTPTFTNTPVTTVAVPTSTPGCSAYTDNFTTNSIGNYEITDGYWAASTAAAQFESVTSGEFRVAPSSVVYPYNIVKDSVFARASGDYTVEGDFKLDTVSQGVFGLIFRATPASAYGYIFQWNGLNSRWELEKQKGPAIYDYPGANSSSPYVLGTWVHLKVVASGSTFTCSIDTGSGPQVIFNAITDTYSTPAPYTTGGVGIRGYNIVGGNVLHVDNFSVNNCPSAPTPTPTCVGTTYSDNFSADDLANSDVLDGYWTASSAGAQNVQITSGEFQVAPLSGTVMPYTIVKNSSFSQALGDYRVEGDFKYGTTGGVFGLVFRSTPASSYGYIFQWNGINGRWELEKQKGPAIYDYPGASTTSPYVAGTWVHLKVVASGTSLTCSIDPGTGPQVIFNAITDTYVTPAPYTAGRVGIRAYNIASPNVLHVDNFLATTCP